MAAAIATPLRSCLAAFLVVCAFAALAGPPPSIIVSNAWLRPASVAGVGAGYLTIVNRGRLPDTLIAVATPVARRVSLHRTNIAGGIASMRRIAALTVAPGATVNLAPGGVHLMLEGLRTPLNVGQRAPLVLTFARSGGLRVVFEVRAAAPEAAMSGMRM